MPAVRSRTTLSSMVDSKRYFCPLVDLVGSWLNNLPGVAVEERDLTWLGLGHRTLHDCSHGILAVLGLGNFPFVASQGPVELFCLISVPKTRRQPTRGHNFNLAKVPIAYHPSANRGKSGSRFMISQQRIITHCTGTYRSCIFGMLAADNKL